jgi:hypothetical protein
VVNRQDRHCRVEALIDKRPAFSDGSDARRGIRRPLPDHFG